MLKAVSQNSTSTAVPRSASNGAKKLRVLAVGDCKHHEFSEAMGLLAESRSALVTQQTKPKLTEVLSHDLLLIFQSRPGSVEADMVERLQHRNPLIGSVAVLGTWCEGETRTGSPLPFCERVFWYHFAEWWRTNLAAWNDFRPTSWQQPTTCARGEGKQEAVQTGLIVVDAPDSDTASTLITTCESHGLHALWSPTWRPVPLMSSPTAAIFVGGQLGEEECLRLANFRESIPGNAALVVLLDFPRVDRVEVAKQLGATAVLGKPWRREQLMVNLRVRAV